MDAAWLTSRPVAHRGLWDLAAGRPENSLAAFSAAAEAGYPIELDVHLTAGGELAILHDWDEELAVTAPRLGEALDLVAGRVPVMVELKRHEGSPQALVAAVLSELAGREGEFALASFDPALVREAKLTAWYPVGLISGLLRSAGPAERLANWSSLAESRPDFISYELAALPDQVVSAWRELGVPVIAWTVRGPADEAEARKHADGIIFDGYLARQAPARKAPAWTNPRACALGHENCQSHWHYA
jgi:glycerophosphoryl diester phosphodiesterase